MPVNPDELKALQGDPRAVPEGKAQPFPDKQAWLALLRQIGLAKLCKLAAVSPGMSADTAD
jgi:hypothetical protein